MSFPFQIYANLEPIYFKITKNGDGVTGQTFTLGDIQLSKDGGTFANIPVDEFAEVGLGWYKWTPTGTETTAKVVVVNISELSGTNFDENGFSFSTGGNASARFAG